MLVKAREKAKENNVSKNVETIQGSMTNLDFPDSYFDVILCHLAFEHIEDTSKTLNEFHRTLTKKGILSLTVPNKYCFVISNVIQGNFSQALKILNTHEFFTSPAKGLPKVRTCTKTEIINMCLKSGLKPLSIKGLRVVSDYLSSMPINITELEDVEIELSEIDDLGSIAAHLYIVCIKE